MERFIKWAAVAVMLTAVIFSYWNIGKADFVYFDDIDYIVKSDIARTEVGWEGLKKAVTSFEVSNWHPLTWVSYQIDYTIFGLNPSGFHAGNLLLHLLNSALLLIVLYRITGFFWTSWIVSMIFALHPLQVESVAWISQRKTVLSTFFMFLAVGAYFDYARSHSKRTLKMAGVVGLFACGLMSKPILVTLPFLLILLDFWPLRRVRWPSILAEKIPLFALSIASSAVTLFAQRDTVLRNTVESLPIWERIQNMTVSYGEYLLKFFWPRKLAMYYPYEAISIPAFIAAAFIIILITFFAVKNLKRRPFLLTGWFWFLIGLVPMIGLVQVGAQKMADRYMYVPIIGLSLITVFTGAEIVRNLKLNKWFVSGFAGTLFLILAFLTQMEVGFWQNSILLFEHTLKNTRNNFFIANNLANAYILEGRYDDGIKVYRDIIQKRPGLSYPHFNWARTLVITGNPKEAVKRYEAGLAAEPGNTVALKEYEDLKKQLTDFPEKTPESL